MNDETLWVYLRSESNLYTVGFYDPAGKWQPESDHGLPEEAAARVHYLNGGTECGQKDRDARILAESNIELLKALKKAHVLVQMAYKTPAWLQECRSEESDQALTEIQMAIARAEG